jgi:hypothetical protein
VKCDLAFCPRDAVAIVRFVGQDKTYPYCYFHAYDQKGHPRWRMSVIEMMTGP